MPLLQQELKRLEGLQAIEPVNNRLIWCLAYWHSRNPTVSRQIHYPHPVSENVLPDLAKASVFTVCDMKNRFWL